jgi:hypothetical protein
MPAYARRFDMQMQRVYECNGLCLTNIDDKTATANPAFAPATNQSSKLYFSVSPKACISGPEDLEGRQSVV